MRRLIVTALIASVVGCDQLNQIGETERAPVQPPGIASPDDISAVERATQPSPQVETPAQQPAPAQPEQAAAPAQTPEPSTPEPGTKSIIGRTTNEVADKQKIMAEYPNLVVTQNKITTENPAAIPGTAYARAVGVSGTAPLMQWLKQEKTLNDRYPSHEQLVAYIKKHNIELPVLPRNQIYAYDASTGEIVVLEERSN